MTCATDAAVVRFWRDAELDAVEVRYSHFEGYRFPAHVHDTWSVGLIDEGRTVSRIAGRSMEAVAGQIVIIPPDTVHDCNPRVGAWTYRMFHVRDAWLRGLADDVGVSLDERVCCSLAPVLTDGSFSANLNRIYDCLVGGVGPLETRSAMVEAFARFLVPETAGRGTGGHDVPRVVSVASNGVQARRAVKRAREYLASHLADKVTLRELAHASGLSEWHLLRVFRDQLGLTPHQWHTQLRLNHARRLLADGVSIADVACATGFTDQSHFTRVFRSVSGTTPRVYSQP